MLSRAAPGSLRHPERSTARRLGRGLGLVGVASLAGLPAVGPARGDEIHLVGGGVISVEAWRDVGDAVEFSRSGGIVRISKADIARIEGTSSRTDLRMYSAPASAGRPAEDPKAAAKQMADLLRQAEGLVGQTVLPADQKAEAFRRLSQRWQGLTVADDLKEVHGRGQRALQTGIDAYTAQAQGNVPNAPALVDQTRTQIQEALGQARKAAGEPG